jgi:hypothetical protein
MAAGNGGNGKGGAGGGGGKGKGGGGVVWLGNDRGSIAHAGIVHAAQGGIVHAAQGGMHQQESTQHVPYRQYQSNFERNSQVLVPSSPEYFEDEKEKLARWASVV